MNFVIDDSYWGSDWIYATDFVKDGKYAEFKLTIKAVHPPNTIETKGGKLADKPVMEFKESKKKLGLCKTNVRILCGNFGQEMDTTKWVGRTVTVYASCLDSVGRRKNVPAVRIRRTNKVQRIIDEKALGTDLTGKAVE